MSAAICGAAVLFQSTLSMRRATVSYFCLISDISISIHALHEESDSMNLMDNLAAEFQSTLSMRRATRSVSTCSRRLVFQSTLSMRRATSPKPIRTAYGLTFQSTLSMRRATRLSSAARSLLSFISIHALHEESDRGCR